MSQVASESEALRVTDYSRGTKSSGLFEKLISEHTHTHANNPDINYSAYLVNELSQAQAQ